MKWAIRTTLGIVEVDLEQLAGEADLNREENLRKGYEMGRDKMAKRLAEARAWAAREDACALKVSG